jgi:hypothetical protein
MVLFLLDPRTDSLLDLETDSKATGRHKASYLSQESEFGKENQCRFCFRCWYFYLLSKKVGEVIQSAFRLLGIDVPERM